MWDNRPVHLESLPAGGVPRSYAGRHDAALGQPQGEGRLPGAARRRGQVSAVILLLESRRCRGEPLLVTGQRAQLTQRFLPRLRDLWHDARLAFAIARLATELEADVVRIEDVDREDARQDLERAVVGNLVRLKPGADAGLALRRDRERDMLHGAERVAVAPLLGALRHLEEREQSIPPHVEEIVADFLERRLAAIAGPGA